MVVGEQTDLEEMGGARMHATISGCGDNLVDDDEAAIDSAKAYFSYTARLLAERRPTTRRGRRRRHSRRARSPPLSRPATRSTPSSTASWTKLRSSELKPLYAPEIVIGWGRLEGRSIGIVANNPASRGGVLFTDSADKAARFIWCADAFNVPLLFLADVPGFMIGTALEREGIIRHGAKMITAVSEAHGAEDLRHPAKGLRAPACTRWPDPPSLPTPACPPLRPDRRHGPGGGR